MGGTTIVYVVHGGNKSVIWTDVVQMTIIWAGIFICAGGGARTPAGGRVAAGRARHRADHEPPGDDGPLDRSPPRLHAVERGHRGAFLAMAYFGADQSQVQRYLSAKSLTEAGCRCSSAGS
jgi:hypothetical protein